MDDSKALWLATFAWSEAAAALLVEHRGVRLYKAIDGDQGRACFVACDDSGRDVARPVALPEGARCTRVELILDVRGAAFGADAPFHYVVSTDILADAQADMNAWYDTEHMRGLAAVSGTVRAQRHVEVDASVSPRYHASYDLADRAGFNSEAWLAVRATPWSSRVRPSFRNTSRVMFERVR